MAERFFVDHGMIHDRITGKHVVTEGTWPYDDTPEMVCLMLNGLDAPEKKPLMWALCRLHIENDPTRYGIADLADFAMRPDAEIDAIADARAFLFEAEANHLIHWYAHARNR